MNSFHENEFADFQSPANLFFWQKNKHLSASFVYFDSQAKIPFEHIKTKKQFLWEKKIRNCRFTIGCLIWWTSKWSQSINLQYLINGIKCILVWRQKTINTDLKGILIDNSLKLEMLEKRLALLRRASFFSVVHVEEFQAQIC